MAQPTDNPSDAIGDSIAKILYPNLENHLNQFGFTDNQKKAVTDNVAIIFKNHQLFQDFPVEFLRNRAVMETLKTMTEDVNNWIGQLHSTMFTELVRFFESGDKDQIKLYLEHKAKAALSAHIYYVEESQEYTRLIGEMDPAPPNSTSEVKFFVYTQRKDQADERSRLNEHYLHLVAKLPNVALSLSKITDPKLKSFLEVIVPVKEAMDKAVRKEKDDLRRARNSAKNKKYKKEKNPTHNSNPTPPQLFRPALEKIMEIFKEDKMKILERNLLEKGSEACDPRVKGEEITKNTDDKMKNIKTWTGVDPHFRATVYMDTIISAQLQYWGNLQGKHLGIIGMKQAELRELEKHVMILEYMLVATYDQHGSVGRFRLPEIPSKLPEFRAVEIRDSDIQQDAEESLCGSVIECTLPTLFRCTFEKRVSEDKDSDSEDDPLENVSSENAESADTVSEDGSFDDTPFDTSSLVGDILDEADIAWLLE